jgi:hypothetical protein
MEKAEVQSGESQEVLAGFDYGATHIFDPKTKRLAAKNPYRRIVIKGQVIVEWPVGSGNVWYEDKTHAGRVEFVKGVREFKKGAKHEAFVPALTADEQLARNVANTEAENQRLKAELEAIKQEQKLASKPAPKASGSK